MRFQEKSQLQFSPSGEDHSITWISKFAFLHVPLQKKGDKLSYSCTIQSLN